MSLPTPNTRKEQYLNAIATGNASGLPTPITREEEYLDAIAKSGGGSGEGDMKKSVYDSDLDVANAGGIGAFVSDAVSGKVDKVEGKGLSTNDYDNTEKGKVADNTSAIEAITEVYGAKNVLPYPYKATTKTVNNVTFTDNGNGTITVNTSNEGCSAWTYFELQTSLGSLPYGDYKINGVPSGGGSLTYSIFAVTEGGATIWNYEGDADITIDNSNKIISLYIGVPQGSVISTPITFKPMIRDARIKDSTYVPYAMTNRELTESFNGLNTNIGASFNGGTPRTIDFVTTDFKCLIHVAADQTRWKMAYAYYGTVCEIAQGTNGSGISITASSNSVTISPNDALRTYQLGVSVFEK